MFSLRAIGAHLGVMRHYLIFGAILFFAGMVVGGTNTDLSDYLRGQIAGLGELANRIDNSAHPTLYMFLFIFLNNAIKSIVIMYLGIAFGIVPIFFLVVNGMVLGFLFTHIAQQEGAGTLVHSIVAGILPHGIIEIPAIIVACAYGMKYGTLSLRSITSLITRKRGAGAEFERFTARTVPVMVLLTVSLLVAAVIESTVTVWLMKGV